MTEPAPSRLRATELADKIRAAAAAAGADPPRIVAVASEVIVPCLLIGPPDFAWSTETPELTWRIIAIAGTPADAGTWDALDHLVACVNAALPIESAAAGAFTVPTSNGPVTFPCYTINFSEVSP